MKVIGVISGKGGVGKTTTVANLGVCFATLFEKKVALLDSNLTTPDLGLHLGFYSFPETLEDVLNGKVAFDSAIYTHPSGLKLLPLSLSYRKSGLDMKKLKDFLKNLKTNEFVLIDSSPGLGEEIDPTLEISDEILIITNPELPAITDAIRAIEFARRKGAFIRGVVLNRASKEKHQLSIVEVQTVLDAPIVAVIPEDPRVRESISAGSPITLSRPSSRASIGFKKLATHLIGEEYEVGFLGRLGEAIKSRFEGLFKGKIKRESTAHPVQEPGPSKERGLRRKTKATKAKVQDRQYWMCTISEENFLKCKDNNIWGAIEAYKSMVQKVKLGDILTFYITKKAKIGGIFEAVTEMFEDYNVVWIDRLGGHLSPDKRSKYPYRVRLSPVNVPKFPVEFRPLVGKLEFIKNPAVWGSYLSRSVRSISKRDFQKIEGAVR